MSRNRKLSDRPWFERAVVAAMVLVGFAIGSVGLAAVADRLRDDPVLTDEFNAPIADDATEDESVSESVVVAEPAVPEPDPLIDGGDEELGPGDERRDGERRPRPDRARDDRRRA